MVLAAKRKRRERERKEEREKEEKKITRAPIEKKEGEEIRGKERYHDF